MPGDRLSFLAGTHMSTGLPCSRTFASEEEVKYMPRTLSLPLRKALGTVLTVALCGLAMGATYHVSPTGNNTNDGSGPGNARALRTIQAAVDRARAGDTCLIGAGVYRETVTFPDSGTLAAPITIRPAGDADVVVSGCDPVTDWERHTDTVWKAPMPWTLGLGRNQVFVDGTVMIEARHPNEPDPGLGMYVSDLSPLWPTFAEFSIPNPVKEPGRVTGKLLEGYPEDHWEGACYHGVHYEGWSAQTGIIESSKDGEINVGDRTRTWWFGPAYGGGYKPEEGRGMIVGHMNALDAPGEWHWQDDTLFLIPKDGAEPTNVQAKRRQLAFDLSGREHIHILGLNVHAASLRLQDSAHCVVDGCHLAYVSHYTRHYAIGQIEDGRDTIKSGETGVFVGGHDNSFLNCSVRYSAGAGFYLRGYHHTVHNCLIDEISYVGHYLNAITDAVSDFSDYENFLVGGHVITYNTMRNAGRHFFNFYGNGTSTASRDRAPMDYMATLFAHNHLYNGMLLTKDAGFLTGYYSSGGTLNGLNSQVVYNVMHDCYDIFAMRINVLGIVYLDAGTCDVDLHHNLLWAAPGSLQRGLWFNTMCVDINEQGNLFHEQFSRTSAELTPPDFPEGRPFRFGHDFTGRPPLPAWPQLERQQLEAEASMTMSPNLHPARSHGLAGLADGGWFCLGDVDFDQHWQTAVVRLASDAEDMNSDRSTRTKPRHRHAADPLVLEAITNDGTADGIRRQWTFLHTVKDGGWIQFSQVPLGDGYQRFRAVYGNDQARPRQLEVHLDSVDGPLVSTVALPQTDKPRGGRIQIYDEAVGSVSAEAVGTRDVFLVFRTDTAKLVGEFEYFRFEQYRGHIPLQEHEVKLELRLDGRDGEKIAELYPRPTGGNDSFRDFVAKLEPVTGKHPLFVTVRSAQDGPIGTIDWLSLERAKHPVDWAGIGESPLMRDGRAVLPKPTHRPCARPADNYPRRAASAKTTPRPMFPATRLAAPPSVDGSLDEWRANERTMKLAESWDGSESVAQPSTAWIGYDDEALYVGVNHPVKDATALTYASHEWGVTDAMEIAVQDGSPTDPGPILNLYGWPDGHVVSTGEAGAPPDVVERLGDAVTYKAAIGTSAWRCEWRIPFAACGFSPRTAPLLSLNLGVRKLQQNAWAIWCGTGTATYVVSNAGTLVFPAELLAAGSVPTDSLEVWLDASDAATVQCDEAGKVVQWEDKSGKARHARQKSPAFRPQYVPDGLNGKPALRFSEETRTRLELPDISEEKVSATIFAVFSNPEPGALVNHDPRLFTASDGKGYDYQIGLCASVPGVQTGGPRQSVFVQKDRWAKTVRVGCFSPAYQTYFTGTIAELLVYSRVMSRQEQDRTRARLMLKWGLQ